MRISFSGFDWDRGNSKKCQKHGVTIKETEDLFTSTRFMLGPDLRHSVTEIRMFAIGKPIRSGRYIFVIFTLREISGEKLLRSISARYMHKQEIELYEKTLAEISK